MQHHYFSNNLGREWFKCCTLISLGIDNITEEDLYDDDNDDYEEEEETEEEKKGERETIPVINLLPVAYNSEGEDVSKGTSKDPWQQGAHTLAASIHQMSSLLQRKSTAYLSTTSSSSSVLSNPTNFMKDSERSMLENT
eukprot:13460712-Ditylum_brightwellii.AAC.1